MSRPNVAWRGILTVALVGAVGFSALNLAYQHMPHVSAALSWMRPAGPAVSAAGPEYPECRSETCNACLRNIAENADAVSFLGPSPQYFAINLDLAESTLRRPVETCWIGGAHLEDYYEVMNHTAKNAAGQVLFYGYTYWDLNGTGRPVAAEIRSQTGDAHQPSFLETFRATAAGVHFAYLRVQAEIRRRLESLGVPTAPMVNPLQDLSSTIQDVVGITADRERYLLRRNSGFNIAGTDRRLGDGEQLRARVRAFAAAMAPATVIFFAAPESYSLVYFDYPQTLREHVNDELHAAVAGLANAHVVAVGEESCGLTAMAEWPTAFWRPEDYVIDAYHIFQQPVRDQFTRCLMRESERLGLLQ